MCVVSMVMDHYNDYWPKRYPYVHPCPEPWRMPEPHEYPQPREISDKERAEELQKFKDLIERARKYDKDKHEPDCELDEKRKALKRIADELGIPIEFV